MKLLLPLLVLLSFDSSASRAADWSAGPLLHEFPLTLSEGHRTEAISPFFYSEKRESQHTWAIPPLFSHFVDSAADVEEFDFLYPLVTYDRYGDQHRLQICQLLSFSGGPTQLESKHEHFTLFPIYFQQRGSDTNLNYTAIVPFYGTLKHRLFRDEIHFVMFPIYGQSRKKDVVTDNYVYPFYHVRRGDGLSGWQFWPFAGHEHKDVTTKTNQFHDIETVGGHDNRFILWPFYLKDITATGTENPEESFASFPFYNKIRSPKRDFTSVMFLFAHVKDREKKYEEWDLPWPFMERARGEGKTADRIFPFYSKAHNATLTNGFIMWPVYKYYHFHSDTLDRERKQVLFFGYSRTTDKNVQTGAWRERRDLLPLFRRRRDFDGNTHLQVLAPIEVFMAGAHKIERDYSPLWSIYRADHNAKTGAESQSVLWNLYRHDTTPDSKKTSVCFGLFQSQNTKDGKQVKLFYIPLHKTQASKETKKK